MLMRWISFMLETRPITAKLGDEEYIVIATKGYPQGGCSYSASIVSCYKPLIGKSKQMRNLFSGI